MQAEAMDVEADARPAKRRLEADSDEDEMHGGGGCSKIPKLVHAHGEPHPALDLIDESHSMRGHAESALLDWSPQCYSAQQLAAFGTLASEPACAASAISPCEQPLTFLSTDAGLLSLAVGCHSIDDELYMKLRTNASRLVSLRFHGCSHVTDTKLHYAITFFASLIELDLAGCTRLTFASLRHVVKHCPALRFLNLAGTCLDESASTYVRRMYHPIPVVVILPENTAHELDS